MVFNQIGLKPVCSAKSYILSYLVFFSDKEAIGRILSHNKEAGLTVKTQHFLPGKTLNGLPSNANIYRLQFRIKTLKANKKGKIMAVLLNTDFGYSRN